jgi:hypothetical protein
MVISIFWKQQVIELFDDIANEVNPQDLFDIQEFGSLMLEISYYVTRNYKHLLKGQLQ